MYNANDYDRGHVSEAVEAAMERFNETPAQVAERIGATVVEVRNWLNPTTPGCSTARGAQLTALIADGPTVYRLERVLDFYVVTEISRSEASAVRSKAPMHRHTVVAVFDDGSAPWYPGRRVYAYELEQARIAT